MRRLGSVGLRLSLALAVVVTGALAVVWIALVPTLQRRLVDAKERQLVGAAKAIEANANSRSSFDQDFVDEAARTATARVVYFHPIVGGASTTLLPLSDSEHLALTAGVVKDPVALRAAIRGSTQRGRVSRGRESFAEAAVPDRFGNVLFLSASLRDTLSNLDLVRTRLVWSGLAALGLAMLIGWGAASAFAGRIRRLERAADRIAAGDFSEPVVDRGSDELGRLAAAFDRMRLQLARLDDARRAFIANASHELRTPLFSLGGFLELLQDEELDDETRAEFLGTMAEQVQRLSKLATDLLDLSRLDTGGLRIELAPVPLAPLAQDLRDEFAAVARRRAHPLEAVIVTEGVVLGDRERVLQIGRALVDNALLHTPEQTTVRIVADDRTLRVEDDGPAGIPREQQQHVFSRFTRLPSTRASGTGLGLAIARELAERMNGELRVDSEAGCTAFTLTLPAAVAERVLTHA